MDFKVIEKDTMYFIGKTLESIDKDEFHQLVYYLWDCTFLNDGYDYLKQYNQEDYCSVIYNILHEEQIQSYLVGVPIDQWIDDDNYKTITIPKGRYIEFTLDSKEEEDINHLKNYIFTEWILTHNYKLSYVTEIEIFSKNENSYKLLVSIK